MKMIIKGKMYNTDTAKLVGDYQSEHLSTDAYYYEEELYLKKTGQMFLYGRGMPFSKYGKYYTRIQDCAAIIPLSTLEAKEWAEKHLHVDDYIELFGEVEE
ncbi:MAG: hypothetical protein N4A64_08940 [Marinisporobacter sp.]|jgi:hypothetical protein|nr:hypothetical protein [Marinisporobacter sp.]